METRILSLENLSSILNTLENDNVKSIQILNLDTAVIPYLDYFFDCCKQHNCKVEIRKNLLVKLAILEHFKDKLQIY